MGGGGESSDTLVLRNILKAWCFIELDRLEQVLKAAVKPQRLLHKNPGGVFSCLAIFFGNLLVLSYMGNC